MMNFYAKVLRRIIIGSVVVLEMRMAAMSDDPWRETMPFVGGNGTFRCDYFCYTRSHDSDYYPPAFPDPCTPIDPLFSYVTPKKETSIQVFWTEPLATDKNGDIPRIEQVIGDTNGSYFKGSADGRRYDNVYLATDEDGLRDSCHFAFKVFDEVNCPAPAVVGNGYYHCTKGTMPGSSCTYKCIQGYRMIGDEDVICQSMNQRFPFWTPIPRCEDPELLAVQCISPQVFYTNSQQTSMTVIWQRPTSTAIVSNMVNMYQTEGPTPGDILNSGLHIVTYKIFRKKSNESAECSIDLHIKVVTCEDPTLIFNDSFVVYNCSLPTVILGTNCLVSCRNNLQVDGNFSLTCVDNGRKQGVWKWEHGGKLFCNETLPACHQKLKPPLNGRLLYINETPPKVVVQCDAGFDLEYQFSGNLSCINGEWVYEQIEKIPECTVENRPDYIVNAEIYYYGQGCSENASDYYQEQTTTFLTDFEELITAECPHNKNCKIDNVSIECFPITQARTKREALGHRLHSILDTFLSRFKRSVSHTFVITFTIRGEAATNSAHDSFDNNDETLRKIWEEYINLVVSGVRRMLLVTYDFKVNYWKLVNDISPTCEKNYIWDGFQCKTCSIGNFLNYKLNKCQRCPVGTYKDNDGIANCISCPDGTSTKDIGTVSVNDCKEYCRLGSASSDGLESCAVCARGYYQDEFGQTGCKTCPDGTTTILANATSIKACAATQTNRKCIKSSCNGQRCLNKGGNISCVCSNGWSGKSCKQPPDNCADNICMNGASCINRNGSYVCECLENYKGLLCDVIHVNGGWTEWSGWSECSVACGQGIRQRSRACENPSPSENGDDCHGPIYETKECVMDECQVCLKLNDTENSSFKCTDDRNSGLKTCSVHCKDGFVSIPGFEKFQEFTCGLPTGWYWLPANVTVPCGERTDPRSLQLAAIIEYAEQIPAQYHDKVKKHVLDKLLYTDCFKYTTCIVEISLLVSQSETMDDRTMLKLYMHKTITLGGNHQGNKKTENAIRDMEKTAAYLKDNTSDIFDVYLNDSVHKPVETSTGAFHADESSLEITGKVVCETGDIASGGICIRCPTGTYAVNGSCQFCIKGTFQPHVGQTTCLLCPPGLTTRTVGAFSEVYCEEEVTVIQIIADAESEDTTLAVVDIIIGSVIGIASIIGAFIAAWCCKDKCATGTKKQQTETEEHQDENGGSNVSINSANQGTKKQHTETVEKQEEKDGHSETVDTENIELEVNENGTNENTQ